MLLCLFSTQSNCFIKENYVCSDVVNLFLSLLTMRESNFVRGTRGQLSAVIKIEYGMGYRYAVEGYWARYLSVCQASTLLYNPSMTSFGWASQARFCCGSAASDYGLLSVCTSKKLSWRSSTIILPEETFILLRGLLFLCSGADFEPTMRSFLSNVALPREE